MIREIMLFISSYVPLYVLLILKNIIERSTTGGCFNLNVENFNIEMLFDEINDYAITILIILIIASYVYLKKLLNNVEGMHNYSIVDFENQTGNIYICYLSLYILPCLGLTLNNIVDVFVILFVMIVVGYVYISNKMTYMNPLLQMMGYKIYSGIIHSMSTNEDIKSVMVSPKTIVLKKDRIYQGSGKDDFIIIVKQEDGDW